MLIYNEKTTIKHAFVKNLCHKSLISWLNFSKCRVCELLFGTRAECVVFFLQVQQFVSYEFSKTASYVHIHRINTERRYSVCSGGKINDGLGLNI